MWQRYMPRGIPFENENMPPPPPPHTHGLDMTILQYEQKNGSSGSKGAIPRLLASEVCLIA